MKISDFVRTGILISVILGGGHRAAYPQTGGESLLSMKMEKEISALMSEGDIPGLSLVIVRHGQHCVKNFGYADVAKEQPVTSKTLFQLGSCSKAFTALAIMQLSSEKKIHLDDNVSDYIRWFKVRYENKQQHVTIRQLLHHTSGIPWSTLSKIPISDKDDALEETVKQLTGLELEELPGAKYQYTTINYDVLALIVQHVTGHPFENYIQENIIDKAHLRSTRIGRPMDSTIMATGYKIGFFRPRLYSAPVFKGNNAAGYVISNGEDILHWLKLQMGLVDSELSPLIELTHQRDESVPLHGMSAYASGWEVSLNGTGEIYHGGYNPNFTSYITFREKEQLGVAVLANSNSNYTQLIGNRVMKALANEKIENEYMPGDGNDKMYSVASIAIGIYIITVLLFIGKSIVDIIKGRRRYESVSLKKLGDFMLFFLMILPFLFGLFIFPEAIVGFSWESILIWSPGSLLILVIVGLSAIGISYLGYLLNLHFPEKNQYKRKLPFILLMSILSGLSNIAIVIMVTSAIDTDIELKYVIFYYALILVIYLLGRRFVEVSLIKLSRGLVFDLRVQLLEKIFSTAYQKFEKIDRGRIYTALNDDVSTLGQATNLLVTLITSFITATGALLYLSSLAFWATALTFFLIISLSAIYYAVSRSTIIYFEEARDEQNVFMRLINGMIDGFKEISLHKRTKIGFKEDVVISAGAYTMKITRAGIRFVNAFLVGESLLVILLGVVSFGIRKIFPDIAFYTVVSFVIMLLYLIGPIKGILASMPAIVQLKVAWRRIHQFINEIPASQKLNSHFQSVETRIKSIKARGITYQYESEDGKHTFEVGPIDFEAFHGEVIFIIGGNGSGKTTFAKLLTGLYEPDRGEIMINENVLQGEQLSEHFSVVFNPAHLFEKVYSIDLRDRSDEIKKLLQMIELEEKVDIVNNNYSTINLSGGQRKRLALLQCYLEDSPIYLFDEWAADQDPEYRNFFYRTLIPEMKSLGKIVIAITHDDHYFDVADRVMKMDQGKLKSDVGIPYRRSAVSEGVLKV
jgi:putative pyoverdin transport system ATP-binding/permease protein